MQGTVVDRFGDENGDLARLCKEGDRWVIERIGEAFSPKAGRVTRTYFASEESARREFNQLYDYYLAE